MERAHRLGNLYDLNSYLKSFALVITIQTRSVFEQDADVKNIVTSYLTE